ncbi:hypothetical protein RhiirA1_458381, partial [Rhizophagus irregularis]
SAFDSWALSVSASDSWALLGFGFWILGFIFRFLGFVRFWVLVYGLLMGFSFSFWTLDRFQLLIVFGIQGSELFELLTILFYLIKWGFQSPWIQLSSSDI